MHRISIRVCLANITIWKSFSIITFKKGFFVIYGMTYIQKAVSGASWIFLMSMFASLIAYITRIVLARHLGPSDFGLFYAVFTFVIFFLFFRDLGFLQALMKYIAEFKVHNEFGKIKSAIMTTFYFQFASSILFGVVFYFLAPYLAIHYFKNPEAGTILRVLIFYIFGSVFFIISKDTLMGFQRTALFSLGEFLKNGLVFLMILLFFYFDKGIYAPVYAFAIVCFLLFLFYLFFLLRAFPLFKTRSTEFKLVSRKMIFFAIPVFATAVGGKIIGYIDTLMLTYFRSLEEVGIYNVILPTSLLFLFFGTAAASIILPMVSELWAKNDKVRIVEGMRLVYRYLFVVLLPVVAILFVFASFFLNLFFGKEYVVGTAALQVLLVGVFLYALSVINHSFFTAIGKPQVVTMIIFISAAVNVGSNLLLIPLFGITGAAVSTSVCYAVAFVISVWKAKSYLGIEVPWKKWGRLLFAGSVFVLLLYQIPVWLHLNLWVEIILSVLISSIVYLLLIFYLKVIDVDEIKRYVRLVRWKG